MHWSHIGHILWQIFYWPGGIIVGNILANIIWEPSRATVARFQLKHQTTSLKAHTDEQTIALHTKLDEHHDNLKKAINSNVET